MSRPSVAWRTRPVGVPQGRLVVGELHLVRRRLDEALAGVGQLQTRPADTTALDEWARVEEAARIASRALRAAIAAVPAVNDDAKQPDELSAGELRVDARLGRQWFADQEFELTPLQHRLLAYLAREPRRVVAKEELRQHVWGDQSLTQTAAINVAVGKLRRRLGAAGARQQDWLINVYGIGWSLTRPESL